MDTKATRSQKSSTVKKVENCLPALSGLMATAFYIFVDTNASAFRGRKREWINARERQEIETMKNLFLTGTVALFLATGAAHAEIINERDFDCGRPPKYFLGGTLSIGKTTKEGEIAVNVSFSNNRERSLPGTDVVIRYDFKTDKLWINGKHCSLPKWESGQVRR